MGKFLSVSPAGCGVVWKLRTRLPVSTRRPWRLVCEEGRRHKNSPKERQIDTAGECTRRRRRRRERGKPRGGCLIRLAVGKSSKKGGVVFFILLRRLLGSIQSICPASAPFSLVGSLLALSLPSSAHPAFIGGSFASCLFCPLGREEQTRSEATSLISFRRLLLPLFFSSSLPLCPLVTPPPHHLLRHAPQKEAFLCLPAFKERERNSCRRVPCSEGVVEIEEQTVCPSKWAVSEHLRLFFLS